MKIRLMNGKKLCTFHVSLYFKNFLMKGKNQENDFRSVSGFIQEYCWVLLRPGSALFYFPINNVLIYGSLRHYSRQEWMFFTSFIVRRLFFLRGKSETFTEALQLKLKQASSQLFSCSQSKLSFLGAWIFFL